MAINDYYQGIIRGTVFGFFMGLVVGVTGSIIVHTVLFTLE